MFRKIVSNLSFSPALVGQLAFYAKRLKKEEATRRLGLIFVALALVVQSLAVFNPPAPANAANNNDLVYGGIRPADGGLSIWLRSYDANSNGLRDITNYFGITRAEAAAAQHGAFSDMNEIRSLKSVGHLPLGGGNEQALTATTDNGGTRTFYARTMYREGNKPTIFWGFKGYSAGLAAKTGSGVFYLMDNCGNILVKTVPNPPPPPTPKCPVPGKTDLNENDPNCFINCTYPGKETLPANDPRCFEACKIVGSETIPINDPRCKVEICPYEGLGGVTVDSPLCEEPEPANLELSKAAVNTSQGNVDATKTTAQAGDQIRYTITIENTGGTAIETTLEDNLFDVVEYATVVDAGGGQFDPESKKIVWEDITLKPDESQARTFIIRVKDEIPTTAQGVSEPSSYDCKLQNVFGNQVIINVDCQPPKIIEQTVTQLPHTGPAENMMFAGVVLAVVTFFYARSRQLGKEVRLIRRDLNTGAI